MDRVLGKGAFGTVHLVRAAPPLRHALAAHRAPPPRRPHRLPPARAAPAAAWASGGRSRFRGAAAGAGAGAPRGQLTVGRQRRAACGGARRWRPRTPWSGPAPPPHLHSSSAPQRPRPGPAGARRAASCPPPGPHQAGARARGPSSAPLAARPLPALPRPTESPRSTPHYQARSKSTRESVAVKSISKSSIMCKEDVADIQGEVRGVGGGGRGCRQPERPGQGGRPPTPRPGNRPRGLRRLDAVEQQRGAGPPAPPPQPHPNPTPTPPHPTPPPTPPHPTPPPRSPSSTWSAATSTSCRSRWGGGGRADSRGGCQ
jgi:hypothetical protein